MKYFGERPERSCQIPSGAVFFWMGLALLAITPGLSQEGIRGRVTDRSGQPIPFANITLERLPDSLMVGYTYTDTTGYYHLFCPSPGQYRVTFRSLGWKPVRNFVRCGDLSGRLPEFLEVQLEMQPLELDTVVVRAGNPIQVRGDTVEMRVSSFRRGNESVVRDVLSRLPGIEVDALGNIRVQGKPVEKVLVEGDDVFGRGYRVLTNNLGAGVIDRVQVLRNFDVNPLLKGIRDSQGVALNLVLKEEAKNSFFGNAALGAGLPDRYATLLNGANLRKGSKLFGIGNLNNTGRDASGTAYELLYPEGRDGFEAPGDGLSLPSHIPGGMRAGGLQENRYKSNNPELAAVSARFRGGASTGLQALLVYAGDETTAMGNTTETYRAAGLDFTNTEYRMERTGESALMGRVSMEYLKGKNRLLIGNSLKFGRSGIRKVQEFNGRPFPERAVETRRGVDSRMEFTRRMDSSHALQVSFRYIDDRRPSENLVRHISLGNFFPQMSGTGDGKQDRDGRLTFIGAEGSFLGKGPRGRVGCRLGFANGREHLLTRLGFEKEGEIRFPGPDFAARVTNQLREFYLAGNLERQIGTAVSLEIGLRGILGQNTLREANPGMGTDFPRISEFNWSSQPQASDRLVGGHFSSFIPRVGVTWKPDNLNAWRLSYAYDLQIPPLEDQAAVWILEGYRTLQKGIGGFIRMRSHRLLAAYQFGNWARQTLVNTSFSYVFDKEYAGSTSRVQPDFALIRKVVYQGRDLATFSASFDWFREALASNLKVKLNLAWQSFEDTVNFQKRTVALSSFQVGAEWRTAWTGGFNFHAGSNWNLSSARAGLVSSSLLNSSFLDLEFRPDTRWFLTLKSIRQRFRAAGSHAGTWLADLEVRFQPAPARAGLRLGIRNVFNARSYLSRQATDTGEVLTELALTPRMFLLEADFRF
ncbi:carboxypeptidase-like regulatory domain-containing protein [Robiginitalea sp. SC105]|uniref:TonB-dependent receptor n=1 Tax=Robiginitalea sp. SC105 TaxID=2762332 RepID=UPI00163B4F94|nr:carboxypeptidase-like regulatory domain-containing protein [Robiginitalea sp. SC105]MBC2839704.1 TonB-dependent receptor [Robiginitalea sp. SC105]